MQSLLGQIAGMPPLFGAAFGFVGAPTDRVAEELCTWLEEIGFGPRRRDADAGLAETAKMLLPLTQSPYDRNLLVGTQEANWTAYFNADQHGGDPRGAVSVLSSRLGVPHIVVYAIPFRDEPDAIPGVHGAVQWEHAPDGSITNQRAVSLVEGEGSSRLHFEAWGPVQPWEILDAYTLRQKRRRLTAEMVAEYCRAVGVDPFDLGFYPGPSVLIERTE